MSTRIASADPIVQTPAINDGPVLLWQGDEYRVIEDRYQHAEECNYARPLCSRTQAHEKHGKHFVIVERAIRTDALGGKAWGDAEGLPPEAIRTMLRALALGGVR